MGVVAVICAVATPLPQGDQTEKPPRPAEAQMGTLRVLNSGPDRLDRIRISACASSDYGPNRLPFGTSVAENESVDFPLAAGCWDIAAGPIGVGDARGRVQVPAGRVFPLHIG